MGRIPFKIVSRISSLAGGLCLLASTTAGAQTLTPDEVRLLQEALANRIEAMTILAGDNGVTGGAYVFQGSEDVELNVTKIGGRGSLREPRPIGWKSFRWSPILVGNFGYLSADNELPGTVLAGNLSSTTTWALQFGGGARLHLTDWLSAASTLSLIYGRTSNDFTARNPAGDALKAAASGVLVDWTLNSMTVVPTFDLTAEWKMGRVGFKAVSDVHYFQVWSFGESSPIARLDGSSVTWSNSIDVDVPLGWKLFGRELHTGGYYSRAELYGNVSEAFHAGHINTMNGRLALDFVDRIWKTRWIGIGGSYFWGDEFSGWAVGADIRMRF